MTSGDLKGVMIDRMLGLPRKNVKPRKGFWAGTREACAGENELPRANPPVREAVGPSGSRYGPSSIVPRLVALPSSTTNRFTSFWPD